MPRKKSKPDDDYDEGLALWRTVERILKGPKSTKKAIVLGVFLMPAGLPFIGVGELIHDSWTTLFGVILFVGGLLLFFGGITGETAV
jgi:hypothetical protein